MELHHQTETLITDGSYGLIALRAAVAAEGHGRLQEFSRAAFARHFVHGLGLKALGDVLAVADDVGLDTGALEREIADDDVKKQLTTATEAAIAAGVLGVPTVVACGQSFWGDDQLDAAAAALRE